MKIHITSGRFQLHSEFERLLKEITHDTLVDMLGRRADDLTVRIQLTDKNISSDPYTYGQIKPDWRELSNFKIKLKIVNQSMMLVSLLHELTHLKQFVKRQLTNKDGVFHWMNKPCGHLKYADQPWEHQARKSQLELYNKGVKKWNKTFSIRADEGELFDLDYANKVEKNYGKY